MRTTMKMLTVLRAAAGGGVAAPEAPTSLTATPVSTSQIDLAWTDNATNETGYKIYRSTNGVDYTEIDDIAAGSESYSDTTVATSADYSYKVAAYNSGGEAESNVDTVTLMDRILILEVANQIRILKLDETSGTNANDLSAENNDATYSGVALNQSTFKDGTTPVGFWDGTTPDYVNLYSAGFDADWNGNAFTVYLWFKASDAEFWTDGAAHSLLDIQVSGSHFVLIEKPTTNNSLSFAIAAGGVGQLSFTHTISSTDWISVVLAGNRAGNTSYAMVNGVVVATGTFANDWVGSLNANRCLIGLRELPALNPGKGYFSHHAVWKSFIASATIAPLSA